MAWEEPRKTGMVYRRLGNSGLHVSALGLGGWLTFGGQVEQGMWTETGRERVEADVSDQMPQSLA